MAVIKVSDNKSIPPIIKISVGRKSIIHKTKNNSAILNKPVL